MFEARDCVTRNSEMRSWRMLRNAALGQLSHGVYVGKCAIRAHTAASKIMLRTTNALSLQRG
jgi:hypothetical protein